MENRLYLTIMTVAASSGDFSVMLETYDAATNVTLVATITGGSAGESEENFAIRVFNQLTTIIAQNDATYNGIPSLISSSPNPTFRLTRTDNSICIFSECQFNLTVTENELGIIYLIDSNPCLISNTEAISIMGVSGAIEDSDGNAISGQNLANVLLKLSSFLILSLGNPFVLSTYRFEDFTNWDRGVQVDMVPLVSVDLNYIRFPGAFPFLVNSSSTPEGDTPSHYHIDKNGWVIYRQSQESIFAWEPFDYNNSVRFTYIAGYKKIPYIVKTSIVELAIDSTDVADSDVKTLRGGSFSVEFSSETSKRVLKILDIYSI